MLGLMPNLQKSFWKKSKTTLNNKSLKELVKWEKEKISMGVGNMFHTLEKTLKNVTTQGLLAFCKHLFVSMLI